MYWSIVYVYTCRTEQLAENIQPDAPIGLVLEHLYRTAGLCVAVSLCVNIYTASLAPARPALGLRLDAATVRKPARPLT
jgi:hypothetical protein